MKSDKWIYLGVFSLLSLHFFPTSAGATTIHVPADFADIQAAIDDPNTVGGDEVVVASGSYLLTATIDFKGKAITLRSASGDPNDTLLDGQNTIFHVIQCISGEGPDTILSSFTITGGNANGSGIDSGGGGMRNTTSSPTVENCIFYENHASNAGGGIFNTSSSNPTITNCIFNGNTTDRSGGGMYNNHSDPTVLNCIFSGNGALQGAGMWNAVNSPIVTNCIFNGNMADTSGGGIANADSSNPIVTNCAFNGNSAGSAGAGIYNSVSNPTLTNCTFSGNMATGGGDGGGIWNNVMSFPTLTRCVFSENTARFGGGMFNDNSSPIVEYCIFGSNSASLSGGGMFNSGSNSQPAVTYCTFNGNMGDEGGGGMYNDAASPTVTGCAFRGNTAGIDGGGMHNDQGSSNPTVTNCLFDSNAAGDNGGGMFNDGDPAVTNCTFAGNTALGVNGGGGMFNNPFSNPVIVNCIFWDNTAPDAPAADDIANNATSSTVRSSDIQGGLPAGSIDGGGNIDVDPLFVDTDGPDDDPNTYEDNDFRLAGGSPCIDAGDPNSIPPDTLDLDDDGDATEPVSLDLAGRVRLVDDLDTADTGVGGPPVVDMGAYEYQGICPGNLDAVSGVNWLDVAPLAARWMDTNCDFCGGADFTDDQAVTLADLMVQIVHWLCDAN